MQPYGGGRIDRAHTRRLVREAVMEYKLFDINVQVAPKQKWADVVRILDGARTCCRGTTMRVKLNR